MVSFIHCARMLLVTSLAVATTTYQRASAADKYQCGDRELTSAETADVISIAVISGDGRLTRTSRTGCPAARKSRSASRSSARWFDATQSSSGSASASSPSPAWRNGCICADKSRLLVRHEHRRGLTVLLGAALMP